MADWLIPHYNNAEGGTHDTRYCYMDERRLSTLEAQLADNTATTAAVGRRPATVGRCQRTESPRPRNAFGSSLQQESVAVAGCEPVLLRLPPGLGPSLDDRPDREQGDDRDHLAAEDDPVDIHRGSPAQLTVADDERPDRAGGHGKAAARPRALALWILAASGAGATLDPGGGDDGHAVLLIGLAEHPLDGQRIARLADDVLHFHALLPSLVPSSILPAWQLMERSTPSFSTIVQDRLMVLARQAPWSATVLEITANLLFSTVQLGLARSGWAAILVSPVWFG